MFFIKVISVLQEGATNPDLTVIVASFVIFILLREFSHIRAIIFLVSFIDFCAEIERRKRILYS